MEVDIHALHAGSVVGHAHPPSRVVILSMLDDQTFADSVDAVVCFGNSVQLVMVLSKPSEAETAPLVTTDITHELLNQRNSAVTNEQCCN
jgi:hypothetical protein